MEKKSFFEYVDHENIYPLYIQQHEPFNLRLMKNDANANCSALSFPV